MIKKLTSTCVCADQIKDSKRLEAEILPKYFKQTRFQNFVQRLLFFNFHQVSELSSEQSVYRHDFFHRDKPVRFCCFSSSSHKCVFSKMHTSPWFQAFWPLSTLFSQDLLDDLKRPSSEPMVPPQPLRRTISTSDQTGTGGGPMRRTASDSNLQVYNCGNRYARPRLMALCCFSYLYARRFFSGGPIGFRGQRLAGSGGCEERAGVLLEHFHWPHPMGEAS